MPKREAFYTKSVRWKLLLGQLVLLYMPALQLFSIKTDNGTIPASLCYFFSLAFLPYLLGHLRTLRLPPWWITVPVLYVWLLAVLRIPSYGLAKNILHWVFGAYLLVIMLNVGADFGREDWLRLLEAGACLFAVAHLIFMILNFRTVWWLLNGYFTGACSGVDAYFMPSLTRGGRNLDCTWMALGGFFVRGRKKGVYVSYVLLYSFVGCCRVGILAVGLLILWSFLYDPVYRLTKKNIKWYALYAAALLALLFCSGMAQAFLGRILIGMDAPGKWFGIEVQDKLSEQVQVNLDHYGGAAQAVLSGRAVIWQTAPRVFAANPWGCGTGNAMRVMHRDYGVSLQEDVVHNVFLQWLLDEGLLGGVWYIALVAAFVRRQWRRRPRFFSDPFDAYFGVWLLLSLIQFHGAEALMLFVLGIYLLQTDARLLPLLPAKGAKG